jgi:N-acetyl-alpha-D-muramate 1-phosphate uridylyltransferase
MKAMIFSAGLGTRFKPWTDRHPKALAMVNGKTLLQRNIEYLAQNGITDLVVNVHHFADQVEDALKKNNGWGSRVRISDEREELLDTGGGLLHARSLFNDNETFITCNVDILTDLDIQPLLDFHREKKSLISFGVSDRKTSRYLLFDDEARLCGWRNVKTGDEKIARGHDVLRQKAYSCVVVFEPRVFDLIPFSGKFSLIDLYLALAADHPIYGYEHRGDRWVDVGKPESVAVAEQLFR